jgi:8-oxo-dGTP pyrophosphatase MutT (NUDIX family)
LIPTHRQPAQTPADIAAELTARHEMSTNAALSAVEAALTLLHTFSALKERDGAFQTANQVSTYLAQSLQWCFEQGTYPLQIGPELLRQIEERRLQQAEALKVEAQPSREQAAVLVLVKSDDSEPCFLHQYDERSRQYQLIGGRIEPGEAPQQAAARELIEEVGESQRRALREGYSFKVEPLLGDAPIRLTAISPTYGALTHYAFYAYQARLRRRALALGPRDRWVSIAEMLSGTTNSGEGLGNVQICLELNQRINGGLASLPSSLAAFQRREHR